MLDAISGALWAMVFKAVVVSVGAFGMGSFDSDKPVRVVHHHHHKRHHRKPPSKMYTQLASWYYDAGGTACGFHAQYGVANKRLPCGTKVLFRYRGRSVWATVQDRGPFVPGRVWDLNQGLAGALGFSGVDYVQASVYG